MRNIWKTLAAVTACVGIATGASAVTISGVAITNSSTVSLTGGGSGDRGASQGTQTLSSGPVSFATRFWASGAGDRPVAFSGGSAVATVNMNYTLTFSATAVAGNAYQLVINTSLLGALTAVDDAAGIGAGGSASVGAVNGTRTGGGTLTGSLGLAGTSSIGGTGGSATNSVVTRNGSATINAVGTGAAQIYTLTFTVQLTASSPQSVGNGDEEAFRFGLSTATGSVLSGASADDYAGIGSRNGLNDGHFVSLTAVPEPGTLLCLGLGLAVIAGRRRLAA